MNRREALKNITIGLGYATATPTILSLLNSCTAKTEIWTPLFLSEKEKNIVINLADIILPASNTPGALDVNTPQFLDLMYHEIENDLSKTLFKQGADFFDKKFIQALDKETSNGTKEDFTLLLNTYFNLSKNKISKILKQQKADFKKIPKNQIEEYSIYKFLISVRHYTLFGYYTSETIGETILSYDPIPGNQIGCIPLEEVSQGKAWSL